MTGQGGGFREAVARFSAEVDAAVTRARRAAAEAGAQTAKFRADNRELGSAVRDGQVLSTREQATAAPVRERAVRFRTEHGLEVEQLPEPEPVSRRAARDLPQPSDDEYFDQQQILLPGGARPYRPESR